MTVKIGDPRFVGDLVVYFINEDEAIVTDFDCRFELKASENSCECCTYRFRSRRDPDFICRHIAAVRRMKRDDSAEGVQ